MVAVSGNLVYHTYATYEPENQHTRAGIRILDTSRPDDPLIEGKVTTELFTTSTMLAHGGILYVAGEDREQRYPVFEVWDVSNPAEATRLVRLTSLDLVRKMVLHENLILAAASSEFLILDVSDASEPHVTGTLAFPGSDHPYVRTVSALGSLAYVAGRAPVSTHGIPGINVIDYSVPSAPRLVGWYGADFYYKDIAIQGSHAYVTRWKYGLEVLDLSDPLNPTKVGSLELVDATDIALSGRYAYVTADNGLHVIDISDPSHPTRVGGNSAWYGSIAIQGDHVLLAAFESDLVIMNPLNRLRFVPTGSGSAIQWDLGTLQFAPAIDGPWTDLPAASPMPFSPIGDKGFFRVRVSSSARPSADKEE